VSLQVETQEAISSALYMMPFSELVAEVERDGEHLIFFHIGEKPKDLRVTVARPIRLEEVRVKVEWRNFWADARNPIKGEQTFTIRTYAQDAAELQKATTEAIANVLAIYQDVLLEEGVAGDISKTTPEVEETEDDEE
jgi:hypothetical protein